MAVEQYCQYIKHLLSERQKGAAIQQKLTAEEYEVQTIFDERQDHYQLLYIG
ncbi:element excision factor XisI family protein [Nostoc spongiaeforme]|uniref:element excision factor XisI family protein n=1 Tax=Nostoc spongiaeforme TaxID=502487 RepID=UPI001F54D894|nr:element excision factor XisI family protein [Nostoc spongiaeforme]